MITCLTIGTSVAGRTLARVSIASISTGATIQTGIVGTIVDVWEKIIPVKQSKLIEMS